MKKIVLILSFVMLLTSNVFAGNYTLLAPSGRIVGEHLDYDVQTICSKAIVDLTSHPEEYGNYKIRVENSNETWILGVGKEQSNKEYSLHDWMYRKDFKGKQPLIISNSCKETLNNQIIEYIQPPSSVNSVAVIYDKSVQK